jgi:hypothetical protein
MRILFLLLFANSLFATEFRGKFITPFMQHPIISFEMQYYFQPEESYSEWIVIPKREHISKIEESFGDSILISGEISNLSLGGKFKNSYSNLVIYLEKVE